MHDYCHIKHNCCIKYKRWLHSRTRAATAYSFYWVQIKYLLRQVVVVFSFPHFFNFLVIFLIIALLHFIINLIYPPSELELPPLTTATKCHWFPFTQLAHVISMQGTVSVTYLYRYICSSMLVVAGGCIICHSARIPLLLIYLAFILNLFYARCCYNNFYLLLLFFMHVDLSIGFIVLLFAFFLQCISFQHTHTHTHTYLSKWLSRYLLLWYASTRSSFGLYLRMRMCVRVCALISWFHLWFVLWHMHAVLVASGTCCLPFSFQSARMRA